MPSRTQKSFHARSAPARAGVGREKKSNAVRKEIDNQTSQLGKNARNRGSRSITPPPGLSSAGHVCAIDPNVSKKKHTGVEIAVKIDGLPNAMLTDLTMDAILEQALLEENVVGVRMELGETCGSATISLNSRGAVDTCLAHFDGRCWDQSGIVVSAQVVSKSSTFPDVDKDVMTKISTSPFLLPMAEPCGQRVEMPSIDMPAYVHTGWRTPSYDKLSVMTTPRTIDFISSSDEFAEVSESETID